MTWIGRVKSALERVLFEPSPVQASRPLSQRLQRVGGRLTPEDVSAILRQADTGLMYRLCDLADDAKQKDCHLGGIVFRRETAVAGLPWQVVPASDRPKARRIAAFVEEVLRALGEDGSQGELKDLNYTISHLNGAVFYGYGVSEVIWDRRGRYVVPVGAIPIAPRRFAFSQQDGSFRWWDAYGSPFPYPGIDLRSDYPPGKFLVHRPRINGSNGCREGLVRPLMWASLFRTWAIGDWMRLAELAWKPYRIGEYEREASSEDKAALLEALDLLTTNGYALIPKTTALQIKYPAGGGASGGEHASLCAFLAAEQSKCVLGATLTVEQGRVGSNALGNVHADVSKAIRDTDARAVEATIRRQLLAPLVRMNFGEGVAVPDFRFLTEDAVDYVAYSTAIDRLAGRGLRIPARWTRATFGIPEPEEGEEILGTGAAAPGVGPAPEESSNDEPKGDSKPGDDNTADLAALALEDAGWARVSASPELWTHRSRKILRAPRGLAANIERDLAELRRRSAWRAA